MSKHILAIEDDKDILELITYNLEREGYDVTGVTSGEDGVDAAISEKPDLVLLDLMLPGMDGLEVCRKLKAEPETAHIPVIMVTAKGEESDIVTGLELGADDYVTKPFSPKVLIARIRAVRRRRARAPVADDDVIRIDDIVIHPGRHEVAVGDERVDLTFTEFRILHILARRPGWVFTRHQIVDAIHGEHYPVTDRAVDVQIVGLRKKLGDAGDYIETVRGVGYRFRDN
ncbi:MAG: response regulator transcription factor [Candidatus Eisenbacteria bacterium]|nr:response regulator transcription factor [Candidatus Eisenbacteria bacterium]